MERKTAIIGAGVTGLAAGYVSGLTVYEAKSRAGGICDSYYVDDIGMKHESQSMGRYDKRWRFEVGGGHWIFGGDSNTLRFIDKHSPLIRYNRHSAVLLGNDLVGFPIQNNLCDLKNVAQKEAIYRELFDTVREMPKNPTMKQWFEANFGETLMGVFFNGFQSAYTANLWDKLAPQDAYKNPVNLDDVARGFNAPQNAVGYNTTFAYPRNGLNHFVDELESNTNVIYNKRVVSIDQANREVEFSDGDGFYYDTLINTLPLNVTMKLSGINYDDALPKTSVLVLNIGAKVGPEFKNVQWLYIPDSKNGFHRIGCYSAVTSDFLPTNARDGNYASFYVEKAFAGIEDMSGTENDSYTPEYVDAVIDELKDRGIIEAVEVVDATWIQNAYTWKSHAAHVDGFAEEAIKKLKSLANIEQTGRYARWHFQGIAESVREGLLTGMRFL